MFLDDLKKVYLENKGKNSAFLRNKLKEMIQYYVLYSISQSVWNEQLIFKGGTCLRFFFDLARLSEDLDFDIVDAKIFNQDQFIENLENYFLEKLQYKKLIVKLTNNKRTIYLKLPILKEVGIPITTSETNVLFVRIDLASALGKKYKTEISIKSTYNFSILVKRYSLPDLFSGKIAAMLKREAFAGTIKKARFKGRDFYDLIWFLEKDIKPNWEYLKEITGFTKNIAIKKLDAKVQELKPAFLETDLKPFLEDVNFVKNYCANFKNLYKNYRKRLK